MKLRNDSQVPDYVEARIRAAPPARCCVLRGSTPVVSFGDPCKSSVATVGLNPSRVEFREKGKELDGDAVRRFETLRSLGVRSLENADLELVGRVWARCRNYFHGNPYWRWFAPLEAVLKEVGASYL